MFIFIWQLSYNNYIIFNIKWVLKINNILNILLISEIFLTKLYIFNIILDVYLFKNVTMTTGLDKIYPQFEEASDKWSEQLSLFEKSKRFLSENTRFLVFSLLTSISAPALADEVSTDIDQVNQWVTSESIEKIIQLPVNFLLHTDNDTVDYSGYEVFTSENGISFIVIRNDNYSFDIIATDDAFGSDDDFLTFNHQWITYTVDYSIESGWYFAVAWLISSCDINENWRIDRGQDYAKTRDEYRALSKDIINAVKAEGDCKDNFEDFSLAIKWEDLDTIIAEQDKQLAELAKEREELDEKMAEQELRIQEIDKSLLESEERKKDAILAFQEYAKKRLSELEE